MVTIVASALGECILNEPRNVVTRVLYMKIIGCRRMAFEKLTRRFVNKDEKNTQIAS